MQFLDQSSIYLMFKRGPKDISIAWKFSGKQTGMWDIVEIVVNRRPFYWGYNASTRFNLRHFASFCVVQSRFLYLLLQLELTPHSFTKSRTLLHQNRGITSWKQSKFTKIYEKMRKTAHFCIIFCIFKAKV